MKLHALRLLSLSILMQGGLSAQSQGSALEVQLQRLPSSNEGTYYDNSGSPQSVRIEYRNNSNDSNYNNIPNSRDHYSDEPYDQKQRTGANPSQSSFNAQNPSIYENKRSDNEQNQPITVKERTLSIIKPDAVRNNHIGDIISRFENSGLRIAGIKMTKLTKDQASQFYKVHRDRPFYNDLVNFMSSGPVVILVLEGDQAIAKNRQLMGATDPKKADKGSIRADYADSVTQNAVHGSDSPETAKEEILFFFRPNELSLRN